MDIAKQLAGELGIALWQGEAGGKIFWRGGTNFVFPQKKKEGQGGL